MTNWFYTDGSGEKRGTINDAQLAALIAQGIIVPTTQLETESGHKGIAGQVPGLFASAPLPSAQTAIPVSNVFCTNCGKSVAETAFACMSCGAAVSLSVGTGEAPNRIIAAVLAWTLGAFGGHKFYLGSWGWGVVFLVALIPTFGLSILVTAICGVVDSIRYIQMTDDEFAEKYSPETASPFRW